MAWVCWRPDVGGAIEVQPSQVHIETALQRGKEAADKQIPPDQLYAWFGASDELRPRGFLMTKINGLVVMAAHFALRSQTPTQQDIAQILEAKTLLISVLMFGERPNFAVDSYMLLDQGGRIVKPVNVRFDGQASRTSVWPKSPAYRGKVVASFAYADFDPKAQTKLSVFPSEGGEVTFDLDFSRID
ncbi:MAG: hypothetical protein ACT4OO_08615 [Nitrospiraceae bacterium]